jgi:hypothetical protein
VWGLFRPGFGLHNGALGGVSFLVSLMPTAKSQNLWPLALFVRSQMDTVITWKALNNILVFLKGIVLYFQLFQCILMGM